MPALNFTTRHVEPYVVHITWWARSYTLYVQCIEAKETHTQAYDYTIDAIQSNIQISEWVCVDFVVFVQHLVHCSFDRHALKYVCATQVGSTKRFAFSVYMSHTYLLHVGENCAHIHSLKDVCVINRAMGWLYRTYETHTRTEQWERANR